jgi:hypothetical protein
VKNAFGISAYSKEYNSPLFFLKSPAVGAEILTWKMSSD